MAIGNISNGETGSSVRGKLNQVVDRVNFDSGWAQYSDGQYTAGNPFVVTAGTTVAIPNNSASTITSQLPTGSSGFYNGTRFTPDASGDAYNIRLSFTAFSSANNGAFALELDISAAGDGSNIITRTPTRMLTGAGSGNARLYSQDYPVYALGTFLANGALPRVDAVTGDLTMYNISFVIFKTHSAR